ncbi:MAG: peptidoglycan DD-metalloendopeptidase family protein [Candidatus Kerfeldbacteria bacterium]
MLGKSVLFVISGLVVAPARVIGRFILKISLPFYRLSFNAKHRTVSLQKKQGGRPSVLALLTSRYIIHASVVVLTLGVAINNVSARGTGLSDIGGDSILSTFVTDENTEDIIERTPATKVSYIKKERAISQEVAFEAELGADPGAEGSVADTGNALQIPTLTSDGIPQRSDVTTYIVQNGDTLGGIANRYGVTQKTILSANSISNADFLKPGQELLIPPITGVLHKVAKGETVASLAKKYEVDAQDILDFNHLADASAIAVDQTLMVPGGTLPEPTPVPQPSGSAPGYRGRIPGSAPSIGGGKLNWPTVGRKINQYFRYGHTGIDAECKYSNPLYAARDGTVSAVIYQRYGYGYHIIVSHAGGLQTLYGHASKIFVKPGQRVARGQSIAMCGSTGRSSGTHVHFETIVNGRKVNPLSYL